MPERIRLEVLKIAFALITMGNSVVLMGWNKDRIVLYLGLATLLFGIFFEVIKETDKKSVIREIIFCGILILLLSIGIAVQDLYMKKKLVLIASVGILAIIVTMSHHMVKDIKSVYSCSIGILIGVAITFLLTLIVDRGAILYRGAEFAITCGMEHKNYFGVTAMSVMMGTYLYYASSKDKLSLLITVLSGIMIILSFSRGAMILSGMFIATVIIYKLLPKLNKRMIIIGGIILFVVIVIFAVNLKRIDNYNHRIVGLKHTAQKFANNPKDFMFGIAGKAHVNDNYVWNVRAYLDWQGTTEMAIVAIMVKGGLLAIIGYVMIFVRYIISMIKLRDKFIKYMMVAVLLPFLLSMLVETYVMNINLVYCSFSYCVIACLGKIYKIGNKREDEANIDYI